MSGDPTTPVTVRPHVTLQILAKEPLLDWAVEGLDRDWGDDRLIASILLFRREQTGVDVRLVTRDTGLMVKAKSRQIALVDDSLIPEIKRISSLTAELERTKRELEEHRQRVPRLAVSFFEGGERKPFVERARQVRQLTAQLKSLSDEQITERVQRDAARIAKALDLGKARATESEIEEYRIQCENYLAELPTALLMQRSREQGPFCKLALMLNNDGTAPATDVRLLVEFAPGTFVVAAEDINDGLWTDVRVPTFPKAEWMKPPPAPTSAPWAGLMDLTNSRSIFPLLPKANPSPLPPFRGPLLDLTGDRRFVEYKAMKLAQGFSWRLKPIVAFIPPTSSGSNQGGFSIAWSLHADELPRPLMGTMNVKWVENERPSQDDSLSDDAR